MPSEEVFLPFPAATRAEVALTTQVKGTWLASSMRAVRAHGRLDDYMRFLPREHHPRILSNVTSDWHPIDLLIAHYEACDRLQLSTLELVQIGQEATKHAHGGVLGMAAKLAANTVVTPWTIMGQFHKMWDRVFVGGGVGIFKVGPKEARLELVQFPCCHVRYCRVGFRGVLLGMTELFCRKAYVSEVSASTKATETAMRIAWA